MRDEEFKNERSKKENERENERKNERRKQIDDKMKENKADRHKSHRVLRFVMLFRTRDARHEKEQCGPNKKKKGENKRKTKVNNVENNLGENKSNRTTMRPLGIYLIGISI